MKEELKLEYFVLNYDVNKKEVVLFNIFRNYYVYEHTIKLCKALEDNVITYEEFVEKLDRTIMFEEHSRCEYEIMVGDNFCRDVNELEQWDCYEQAHPNIEAIAKYVLDKYETYSMFNFEDECCCDCCEEDFDEEPCFEAGCDCDGECCCDKENKNINDLIEELDVLLKDLKEKKLIAGKVLRSLQEMKTYSPLYCFRS